MVACASTQAPKEETSSFATTKKATQLAATPVTVSDKWKLAWQDNFEGDSINKRNWSLEENCWGGGNNEQQCYTKRSKNAFVKDGFLHIVARKESYTGADDPNGLSSAAQKTLPYTSARLRTKGKRDDKYGRFEIRAKLPSGQGTWPAIWMLPTDNKYGTWAASGEIDIVEAVNLKAQSDAPQSNSGQVENRIYGTLHYGKQWPDNVHSGIGVELPNGINPADDFHNYAIEWEEGEIRWYVDNIHYATQTHEGWYAQYKQDGELVNADSLAPFNERFHMILNLAVGGSWAANANQKGVDADVFPQTMLVDYVKVYRCSTDRWKGKGCSSRSEQATHVKGNKAPAILVQDDSYADGKVIEVFNDSLNTSLAYGSYDPVDIVEYEEVDIASGGKALSVIKQNGAGNIYFRSPPTDFTSWLEAGELVFDIKVLDKPSNVDLVVKMDSGWPKTSDLNAPLEDTPQWQTVRMSVADIIAGGNRHESGNAADPANINNLLVFEPTGQMSFELDNIRFER
ncbi:glycoside hydrolase family 16 protein [Vibrio sp. SCSIO 43136]|uniref:glycoside hydrolase family 16 protein n=1 Tax=Vibrio sp. SCSIO 43136 TaxID=2819101 RepID=UPI0020765DCA|nr:glycoside hydrolase family 16 protein [Vibrio sp. SCSIO 43136]USD68265.1 family 16 glycosylhydrolase [Vibrio sp. SCSIO 43136]